MHESHMDHGFHLFVSFKFVLMSSGDCGQIPQSPQMERGSSTVDGGQSKPKVKRAKNGRTVCVTQSHTQVVAKKGHTQTQDGWCTLRHVGSRYQR